MRMILLILNISLGYIPTLLIKALGVQLRMKYDRRAAQRYDFPFSSRHKLSADVLSAMAFSHTKTTECELTDISLRKHTAGGDRLALVAVHHQMGGVPIVFIRIVNKPLLLHKHSDAQGQCIVRQ